MTIEAIKPRLYPGKPFPVIGYISKNHDHEIFCPFCGMIHTHGTDREEIEPGVRGPVIGCRVPHCWEHPPDKYGYDIVTALAEPMPKELQDLGRENRRRAIAAKTPKRPWRQGQAEKVYYPRWLAGWVAGWRPGTAPDPDWKPHPYTWCDIDPKWRRRP